MKILHVRSIYLGVSFVYYLIMGLKNSENYIVSREIRSEDDSRYPFKNVILTPVRYRTLWNINKYFIIKYGKKLINDWFAFKSVVRNRKYDLIHAHMGPEGFYAMPLSKHLNVPLVVSFYGGDMSDFPIKYPAWIKRYKELFDYASLILVEGEVMKSKIIDLGCPPSKVYINKISVPLNRIKYRQPIIPNENKYSIFMCASFVYKKGFDDAISTIDTLNKRGYKISLHIVGDGMLDKDIKQMVARSSISRNVTFYGRMDVDLIYNIARDKDIFFHPSKTGPHGESEGGAPTIILEMQALGLPIVSTFHADIPNIIPKENQYLAEENNVHELVKVFEKLIKDKESWVEISLRGRKFIEDQHSNLHVSRNLEEQYRKIIENQRQDT